MNWKTLTEEFLRYKESGGSASATLSANRISLQYWLKYLEKQGVSTPSEVTPQLAAGYQAWIYNYRTRYGRPFTVSTQIMILNSLQVFGRYLVKTGKAINNPVEVIHLPKKPRRLPAVILSPREMTRLLAQPDTATVLGFRDRTMYEVLYSTGLRIGELIRLRVQDLRLSEGMLFVFEGKGVKDRVVPLGATACRYLETYLDQIRPRFRPSSSMERVFFNKMGNKQEPAGIGNKLHLYALRAGIRKRVTVHTFRHTLATEMLKGGADLRQIQELLGHGNLRTTQLYTHVVKGELKRVQSQCHPREQTELPENFVNYRGRKYLTDEDRREVTHVKRNGTDET